MLVDRSRSFVALGMPDHRCIVRKRSIPGLVVMQRDAKSPSDNLNDQHTS